MMDMRLRHRAVCAHGGAILDARLDGMLDYEAIDRFPAVAIDRLDVAIQC
jgi:hypothetical protein